MRTITLPVPISGDIPGNDGRGLAETLLEALSVPIGLRDGLSPGSTSAALPRAREAPRGDELGDVDVDGVVVGTGELVVLGGEEEEEAETPSWGSGVNRAPGVVMYRGWVIGSAAETEGGRSGSETGVVLGRLLGWAMSFHTLGLSAWPT